MNKRAKNILLLILFFTVATKLFSQSSAGQYLSRGIYAIEKHSYDSAITYLSKCIKWSRESNNIETLEQGLQNRAYAFTRMAQADSAKQDYFTLLETARVRADKKRIGELYILLGKICRENSQYDSCIYYGEKSMAIAEPKKDTSLIAKSNFVMGLGYFSKSLINKANEYWIESLRMAETIKDSLTVAEVMSCFGIIKSELKNQQDALITLDSALAKTMHNRQFIESGYCHMRMGVCYKRLKQYDNAVLYYKKAMLCADTLNEIRLTARAYHNLSDVYAYEEKFDSALFYNLKSITLNKKIGTASGIILSQNALGQLYRIMGGQLKNKSYYLKAIPLFEEDLALARKINWNDFVAKCYEEMAYCHEGLGDFTKAYQYFLNYHLLNDSIRSEKTAGQVADLQTKYETEKKENEITKLNSEKLLDTEKIARQKTLNYSLLAIAGLILISGLLIFRNVQKKRSAEKQIAILEKQNAIESMRSKIASDVHDDMGANLTKLGLNAQQLLISAEVPEKEKQLLEKISLQSREVIAGMREIIWASNPANDNLKSMLGFMRQYIDRFFDGTNIRPVVNFPHDAGEVTLHPEVRRNLFLILKESLNNAVKYSGSDKIDIDFNNENEKFNLNIKDYGKGMDNKTKDDFSNGLRNMQVRAEQIQSLFRLITAPGKGVQISIEGKLY